ncbi:hypothetical protein [Pseudomonas antarctica]|uniref:hypothetical protein n=1 Tax=Pseudomonas antarctica TaxID=219572 RepID=UPI00387AA366
MTDHTELKRLAEAAPEGPWFGPEYAPGTSYVFDVDLGTLLHYESIDTEQDACLRYVAAANPAAVLALIAENERLESERAELWRGKRDVEATRDTKSAVIAELKAQIAGLKTGYEAYERVNAELKAEVGSLTKEADTQYTVIEKLKADNDRIERNRDMWKGQVEQQAEELTALRGEVAEWKDTVKFNEKCWSEERGTLIDKLQESRMRIKELDLLFGRYILAMRSALIEEEHGKGPAAAMEWIYNSLAGPGELPPEGETESQAYFDREIVAVDNGMQEVMAFHEGRRAAMGQGERP